MNWTKILCIVVFLQREKYVQVVWLNEQHKDNDSSGKKPLNLYSPGPEKQSETKQILAAFIHSLA